MGATGIDLVFKVGTLLDYGGNFSLGRESAQQFSVDGLTQILTLEKIPFFSNSWSSGTDRSK